MFREHQSQGKAFLILVCFELLSFSSFSFFLFSLQLPFSLFRLPRCRNDDPRSQLSTIRGKGRNIVCLLRLVFPKVWMSLRPDQIVTIRPAFFLYPYSIWRIEGSRQLKNSKYILPAFPPPTQSFSRSPKNMGREISYSLTLNINCFSGVLLHKYISLSKVTTPSLRLPSN